MFTSLYMGVQLCEWSQYIDETFHGADVYDDIWQEKYEDSTIMSLVYNWIIW